MVLLPLFLAVNHVTLHDYISFRLELLPSMVRIPLFQIAYPKYWFTVFASEDGFPSRFDISCDILILSESKKK
jgi:hypothetical protein